MNTCACLCFVRTCNISSVAVESLPKITSQLALSPFASLSTMTMCKSCATIVSRGRFSNTWSKWLLDGRTMPIQRDYERRVFMRSVERGEIFCHFYTCIIFRCRRIGALWQRLPVKCSVLILTEAQRIIITIGTDWELRYIHIHATSC